MLTRSVTVLLSDANMWQRRPLASTLLQVANDENPDPSYWRAMLPLIDNAISAATWHMYTGAL